MGRVYLTSKARAFPYFLFYPIESFRSKLATLLFEEVLVHVEEVQHFDFSFIFLAKKGIVSKKVAKNIEKIWQPVENKLKGIDYFEDEWIEKNKKLWDTCCHVVDQHTKKEYPKLKRIYYKSYKGGQSIEGHGSHDFKSTIEALSSWLLSNANNPCALLGNELENKVVNRILKPVNKLQLSNNVSEMVSYRIPNFDVLTWEDILLLRKHPNLKNFRSMLNDIIEMSSDKNLNSASHIFNEIERKMLWEFLNKMKISTKTVILNTIVSNLPLTPLNPISIGNGIMDILKSTEINRNFGWLFFLSDVDKLIDKKLRLSPTNQ